MAGRNEGYETSVYDLIIRNVLIEGDETPLDIGIAEGKIKAIDRHLPGRASEELDGNGCLASPPLVDPHTHLDKAYLLQNANRSGTLFEAIRIVSQVTVDSLVSDIEERAEKAIRLAIKNGTSTIRTHVDVTHGFSTVSLERMLRLKEKWSKLVDIQIVPLPMDGLFRIKGSVELLKQAMRMGADVVGGIPAIEETKENSQAHVDAVFNIAAEFNCPVDVHVDETDDPSSRTLEMVANTALAAGWNGRVSAAHVCALAAYDDQYAGKVIQKVAEAGMTIITNPPVNLVLQGRQDRQPVRRGITRVKELLTSGVNVTCGNDNHRDVFFPFGKADMLEVAYVTALAAHMTSEDELKTVMNMPRYNAAKSVGIKDYGIHVGGRANLIILPVTSMMDALALKPPRRAVIRDGRMISQTVEVTKSELI